MEETQAADDVLVKEVAEETEIETKAITEEVKQAVKEGKKEEDETDGEFIKVEKESIDGKENNGTMAGSEDNDISSLERRLSNSTREVLEGVEKIKELETELARLSGELKENESENMEMKEKIIQLKETVEKGEHSYEELKLKYAKLEEQMTETNERHATDLNSMNETHAAKSKELTEVKESFDGVVLDLETSRKKILDLGQELESSVIEAKKFEDLHKEISLHAESEKQRALEYENLLETEKANAKERESNMAALQQELEALSEKIVESKKVEESLQNTMAELAALKEELLQTKSQHDDTRQILSTKEGLVDELSQELEVRKVSESQAKDGVNALENLLSATKDDLHAKVSEFEEIKLQLQEESKARESFESGCKAHEAQALIIQDELDKLKKEKQDLEATVVELTGNAAELKDLVCDLKEKLKQSDENFGKANSLLSEALLNNTELESKLKISEEAHTESTSVFASVSQRNVELEDLIRTSKEAVDEATTQKNEHETRYIAAQQRILELEQDLNLAEAKSKTAEQELQETSSKIGDLVTTLKEREEDIEKFREQVKEYEAKKVELDSLVNQLSSKNSDFEGELKSALMKCAEHEDRANMHHQRSLELEDLCQQSHSKFEDEGKKVSGLELLLETEKYRIQELETQIVTLESKCAVAEADSIKLTDKVSELSAEIEALQEKSSNLESMLQLSNEKEEKLIELLNAATEAKKKNEDECVVLTGKLADAEDLLQVLRNERSELHEKLEGIENDLKASGLRESDIIEKLKSVELCLEQKEKQIEETASQKLELESLHETLKMETDAKLQEVLTNLSMKDSEATSLHETIKSLDEKAKLHEEHLADATGRHASLKEELDACSEKLASLEEQNEVLKAKLSDAEHKVANSDSENKALLEINNQLNVKVEELQKLLDTAVSDNEVAAQQLASHQTSIAEITELHTRAVELHTESVARIVERDTQLQDVTTRFSEVDAEKNSLNEKLNDLQELKVALEKQVIQASNEAEETKLQLENILASLKHSETAVEELQIKSGHIEGEKTALTEQNMKLGQELATHESKVRDLEDKLSATIAEMQQAVEQVHLSKNIIDDITHQHKDEGQRLQLQIDEQLKLHKEKEDAFSREIEQLREKDVERSKFEERVKELEELLLAKEEMKLVFDKQLEEETSLRVSAEENLESKHKEVESLERKMKDLEGEINTLNTQKDKVNKSNLSELTEDGVDISSREIGATASANSRSQTKSGTDTTSEVSPVTTLKFIIGVALVSVIVGIILGKRY